jgi:hypothetical protein
MSSVMAVALNAEQERSQNALASKHTHAPELPASSRGTRAAVLHPERIAEEKEVGLLSLISSVSPLFAIRKCSPVHKNS